MSLKLVNFFTKKQIRPSLFHPAAGEAAHHLHLFNDVDPAFSFRTDAIARAVAKVRHPAYLLQR